MKKLLLLSLLALSTIFAKAQSTEDYFQLLAADLNTNKKAIFVENMQFSEEESKIFWPIYDNYRAERDGLSKEKLAIYEAYIDMYENLDEEKGESLMTDYFKIEASIAKLEKSNYLKMKQALSVKRAVQFLQIENRINMLIQIEVLSALPIVQP